MEPYTKQTVEASSNSREKDHTVGSRALVATAFGVVIGGKANNIGMIMDANHLLNKKNRTAWQKVCSPFNKELWNEMKTEFKSVMQRENKGYIATIPKVFQYTVLTSVIGGAIGAALGWKLGGRIDNWRDIIHHPIDSTKIVLGFKEPKKTEDTALYAKSDSKTVVHPEQTKPRDWQSYTKERRESAQKDIAVSTRV